MKASTLIGLAVLALAGCDHGTSNPPDRSDVSRADDTRKNERDRSGNTLTPMDQGESETDRGITQQIRQSVVKDDTLSMTAKNVKIITREGVVTLRGPVKSDAERRTIVADAQGVTGVKRVDNQLEIAPN